MKELVFDFYDRWMVDFAIEPLICVADRTGHAIEQNLVDNTVRISQVRASFGEGLVRWRESRFLDSNRGQL